MYFLRNSDTLLIFTYFHLECQKLFLTFKFKLSVKITTSKENLKPSKSTIIFQMIYKIHYDIFVSYLRTHNWYLNIARHRQQDAYAFKSVFPEYNLVTYVSKTFFEFCIIANLI